MKSINTALCLLLAGISGAASAEPAVSVTAADLDRITPAALGAPRPYVPGDIVEKQLPNGLKAALVEAKRIPIVTMSIVLPFAGGVYDPQGKSGLSSVAASMLGEGITNKGIGGARDGKALEKAIDRIGAQINAAAGPDAMVISILVGDVRPDKLLEKLDKAVGIVSDMIRHPAFPADSLEMLKQDALTQMQQQKKDPNYWAARQYGARVLGDHPYGAVETEDMVKHLTVKELKAFRSERFSPEGALVTAAGDISMDQLETILQKNLGDWKGARMQRLADEPAKWPAPPAIDAPGAGVIDLIAQPESPQSTIHIGHLGITRDNPDFRAVSVMNFILGGDTIMSRIGQDLRERNSWSYGATSGLEMFKRAGTFDVSTSVQADKTAESVKHIVSQIRRMQDEGVSDEELAWAKRTLVFSFIKSQAEVQNISGQIVTIETTPLPKDALAKIQEAINAVTAEDVREAAQRYLHPAHLQIVVVGDVKKNLNALLEIAPVRLFDSTGEYRGRFSSQIAGITYPPAK